MARAASLAIAFNGLCVGISAAALLCCLSQPESGAIDAAVLIQMMLPVAAVAAFFTAVTVIYVGRGGRGAGVGNWRIPAVVVAFILCASIGILDLFFFMQPGPMDGVQAALLGAAAFQVLPPAAAATFFLAVSLVYVHGRATAAGGGGAANEQSLAAMEVLDKMTLAATLFTAVLSLIAVFLISNTK